MENNTTATVSLKDRRSKKMLLYIGIGSITMAFASLTSAYVVSQASTYWVHIDLPSPFWISTLVIMASSFAVQRAVVLARKGKKDGTRNMLLLTLALGIAFGLIQYNGWKALVETGNFVVGEIDAVKGEYGVDYLISYQGQELIEQDGNFYLPSDVYRENPLNADIATAKNTASAYLYVLTALHLAHLLGGLIYLLFLLLRIRRNAWSEVLGLKVKLCAIYWHFLDGLWIYLFLFLMFIH